MVILSIQEKEKLKVFEVTNQALREFFRNKKINKKTIFTQREVNRESETLPKT